MGQAPGTSPGKKCSGHVLPGGGPGPGPGNARESPTCEYDRVLTEGLEEVMEVWVSLLQLLQLQPDLDGKKMDEGVNDSRAGPRTPDPDGSNAVLWICVQVYQHLLKK